MVCLYFRAALEFGIREKAICSVTEVEEGSETARFRRALGGSAAWRAEHKPFHSLLKGTEKRSN